MPDLETRLSVNTDSRSLYLVAVNDNGPDSGSTTQITIGGFPGTLDDTHAKSAVRALADSFTAATGYTLVSISRVAVAETPV